MRPFFDTHIAVDWSARSSPSPQKPSNDSIWIGIARQGARQTDARYFRTRVGAAVWLLAFFKAEIAAGRRVLAGFDFPFGYPAGVAEHVTGDASPFALWDWFNAKVMDGADNANNRYAVAEALNRLYDGIGPCWGRPATWDYPDVPTGGKARRGSNHPPERRAVERRAKGAKTVWQLAYSGSVGSQVILGLPVLNRFRTELRADVAVWPFDGGLVVPEAPIVLMEIYPSLFALPSSAPDGEIGDAYQVRVTAEAYRAFDQEGTLAEMFGGDGIDAASRATLEEEGWILGFGHPALRAGHMGKRP